MEILKGTVCVRTNTNTPPINIEIIGIDLEGRVLIKYINNNEIYYADYIPCSKIHIQLYFEIINKSYLWNIEYITKQHISRRLNEFLFDITFKININLGLIDDYINTSLALNYIIIDTFSEVDCFEFNDLSNKSIIPINNNIILPNTFKLTLYEYQKKSLAKMIALENQEIQTIQYSYNMSFHNIKLIFDPFTNTKIDNELYFNVKTKGGILSDEMGLGKTITSIALILSNPSPINIPDINNNNSKINSKATVIICPSHLAKQWETEIKRCADLKIITVLTKTEYNHYKFEDFIKADIIITSHQFIMNLKFYQSLYYKQCTVTQYNALERQMIINRFLLTNLCDLTFDEIKKLESPLFEFFNFHRIILDEGHEIFAGLLSNITLAKCISNWVALLDCNNYWYVSGTPFINYNGVKNAANFIKLVLEDNNRNIKFNYNTNNFQNKNIENFMHKEYLWNNILEKICIRHRKCDIENQINIPGYEEKIIWLNFTDIEKKLYDAKKIKSHDIYLQQLCCHPLIVETSKKIFGDVEVDLSLMQDKLIEYHKKNYTIYKQKLDNLVPGKPEYHMLKKNFETQMTESHYLYTILEKMKKPDELDKIEEEICCICMEDIKIPAMTACGHILCSYCLKECLKHKNECPMCKTNLQGKEVFLINKKQLDDINPLIMKYGSKLGKLILYIKSLIELENSKIIVFSQWDDMLSLIGKTLLENNINNSFVKGNLWKRNSAINKFTSGTENKVIMLSLKNAASGTNLTNATHIFFVEPINATREEIKSIESQAIARACRIGQKEKISIIRILIKDTIEEEIYNKNYT